MQHSAKKFTYNAIIGLFAAAFLVVISGKLGAGSLLNNQLVFGYGGGGGTLIPQPIVAVNQPLYIPNGQREGRLFHKSDNNMLAELEVPHAAVSDYIVFEAKDLLADAVVRPQLNGKLLNIVGNRVFVFSAHDKNNNPVSFFERGLMISLSVPEVPEDRDNLGVYYLNALNRWVLIDRANFDPNNKTSFEVEVLSVVAVIEAPGLPRVIESAGNFFPVPLVLGAKEYPDDTLVRNSIGEVYWIKDGFFKHIGSPEILRKEHAGKPIINVGDEVIDYYRFRNPIVDRDNANPNVAARETAPSILYYADGALVRTPDNKVYVVENSNVRHIATLSKDLTHYAGRRIYEINSNELAQYRNERLVEANNQVLGTKVYGEGALLRTRDWKVYVVENNSVRHIATLPGLQQTTYEGKPINEIDYGVLTQYRTPEFGRISEKVLGVKNYAEGALLKTPDNKVYVIEEGKPRHILTLEELRRLGESRIISVDFDVITNLSLPTPPAANGLVGGPQRVLGVKQYPNGTLLRTPDWKTYIVKDQKVHHFNTIPGPATEYQGQKILDVDFAVIVEYEILNR